jgi:5-oxoprolinase (ATP-hydrolysing) subunit C
VIEVLAAGPLTSVQDPFGRPAWRHLGVPTGGAADSWSARLANRLVGNPEGSALLEITLGGLELRFETDAVAAVTGGVSVTLGGIPGEVNLGFPIRAGGVLRIDGGSGARGYLAVAGGIVVEPVLGSASTDLRTGFGGHHGRALRPGDRLSFATAEGVASRWTGSAPTGPIRITPGPHATEVSLDGEWVVGPETDRTGMRLDGRTLVGGEVPSMGLPLGAIQVPPDGRPIVVLVDRPVTGGYPVPACVIRADIGRMAQLRPGDRLRFASVSVDDARSARRKAEESLDALETVGSASDDDLRWIGSHE